MQFYKAVIRIMPGSGRVGLLLVVFWVMTALFGPYLAPDPVGAFVDRTVFSGMSSTFWLGGDYLGRDVLSRLLWGARYTTFLAFGAAALAGLMGTSLALLLPPFGVGGLMKSYRAPWIP